MTSVHGRHLTFVLLLLALLLPSSWWSSEAKTNNVPGPRDNSLSSFDSKLTAAKDRKTSDWMLTKGSTSDHHARTFSAAWTPVCRNNSCPSSPGLDQELVSRAQDNERQNVVDLMRSVSEELSGLRSALQHLKLDSQTVHRQVSR